MWVYFRYDLEYSNSEQETHLTLTAYPVFKETEKWYWVRSLHLPETKFKKWIPKEENWNKQFAWSTPEKAMRHFIRRTKKRVSWLNYWKEQCEIWVNMWKHALQKWLDQKNYENPLKIFKSDFPDDADLETDDIFKS